MNELTFTEPKLTELEVQSSACFQFGLLFAQIHRLSHEWQIEYSYAQEPEQSSLLAYGESDIKRIISREQKSQLEVKPRLADRSIVNQPLTAIQISPGAKTTLYVSTPLWVAFFTGNEELIELPLMRLSDSWFGPNTLSGELCYSSTTRARLELQLMEQSNYKAITPISIINKGEAPLPLTRINVPVANLSLYLHQGHYWTSPLDIVLEYGLDQANVTISPNPPLNLIGAKEIAAPRIAEKRGGFQKTLNLLFA